MTQQILTDIIPFVLRQSLWSQRADVPPVVDNTLEIIIVYDVQQCNVTTFMIAIIIFIYL